MPREIVGGGGTPFVEFDPRARRLSPVAPAAPPVVEVLPATAFEPEAIDWLWPNWLACGKLHLLAGAAGTGKTTIALSLAASLSRGGAWPDGTPIEPADVVIWTGEDGIADTLLPRLLVAGGDPRRVHFVTGASEGGRSRPFDPAHDMAKLAEAVRGLPPVRLLILDPVVAAVTGDSHKNTETRRGLQPVVGLAANLGCAVLGITHLSKNSSGREPLDRVTGSVAFGAVARIVLATVKAADPNAPRRLVRAKSNLGPDTGGFAYMLVGAPVPGHNFHAQGVEWGEPLEGSARELMAIEDPEDGGRAAAEAERFLSEMLASGPVATVELREAANAHGHAWRTLQRIKDDLGVVATKVGFKSGWAWRLPEPKSAIRDAEERQHD
jgi:putative DNA primase/helicase